MGAVKKNAETNVAPTEKSVGSTPQAEKVTKVKKDTPAGAPECFGAYPKDCDPGKTCRCCRFAQVCK